MNKFSAAYRETKRLLGKENVLTDEVSLALHSYDCSLGKNRPDAVLRVAYASKVAPLIKILNKHSVPFTARSAATNHAGACVPLRGGAVLNLAPLNKITEINTEEKYCVCECAASNAEIQRALGKRGFFYAPDPASEKICTIGGNAALNAGGARGLKYGSTDAHILEIEFVTPDGNTHVFSRRDAGPDIRGLIIGSEGTLGIITKLKLQITPLAGETFTVLTAFGAIDDAMRAVSEIIAEGIIPRSIEAMDRATISMVQSRQNYGYPEDCEALLLIETDGKNGRKELKKIEDICKKHNSSKTVAAATEEEKEKLWKGRRAGYAAMAVKNNNVFVEDGTVPRKELARAIKETREICAERGLETGLFFHAGDGNLHPNILFDARKIIETKSVMQAGKEILKSVVNLGGTISGEHGVGIEKRAAMALMFSENEIDFFNKIKTAFDPRNICNPDKIIPISSGLKDATVIKDFSAPEIDAENGVVSVNASAPLKKIAALLKKQNLFLKIPSGYEGTAGGLFESGLCPEFTQTVTGITAEDARARPLRFGGKFVKNAAGYNLIRLLSGARGTYAKTKTLTLKIFREKQSAPLLKEKSFAPPAAAIALKKALDPENILNGKVFKEYL